MADESKPVTSAEPAAPVADAAPAVTAETKPAEETPAPAVTATEATTEVKADEAAPAAEASAAAEAAPAEAEAAKEAEPIYSGTLQYSNHPIKSLLQLKPKFHFYFGSDAVKAEADKLKHLVKTGEPQTAHTVAWSNETGLGLLYYVKDAEQKDSPQGALNLSEVENLSAAEPKKIIFRLHGSKHTFTADTQAVRDGWYKAFEEHVAKAKEIKETIVSSSGFKETYEKLTKPALAVPAESAPKKSTDSKSVERTARSESAGKKRPSKDRSQSRGKKFFDQLRGKKEETKDEATEEVAAADAPTLDEPTAEPADATAPVVDEPAAAVEPTADEPKKTRRTSKFFDYVKAMSPTREKKQDELVAPEADGDAAPAADAAVVEPAAEVEPQTNGDAAAVETPAAATEAPAADAATETAATDAKAEPAAPGEKTERRRSSFFGTLAGSVRNTLQKKPEGAKDEPKTEEAATEKPAEAPVEPAAEAPVEASVEPKKENKVAYRVGELRRNLSKALRGNKDGKKAKTPGTEKVEESAAESKPEEEAKAEETAAAEPAVEEPKAEAAAAPSGPTVIGDVVGEAVTVGTAPPSNPTVSATA